MASREVYPPGDPRAPAVTPKSPEERRRDEVSVADLLASYPGVPRPVKVGPLREGNGLDDIDPGGRL